MNNFVLELLGTMFLVLLGDGVVANVVLKGTKGNNSGWIVITTGWAMAVGVNAFIFTASGAHFNPALTIGLATIGKFAWADVPLYIAAQMIGAFLGACLVYVQYKDHFNQSDPDSQLGVFSTGPAIRNTVTNLLCEIIATFFLVFAILGIGQTEMAPGISVLGVIAIIWVIGICLGGTTGYAINPARDLGPRIAHAVLPLKGKRDSDWGYAWIPVVGPIVGAIIAAQLFNWLVCSGIFR
ncbi:Glyceroaquaporin [uncultured Clostridium sp.]|uniref:MIP/aquaporin family protein n=1 Tax=uncultured Clostridium sp. TaxID=59620 RepID=UPI0008220F24|nr:MIP/aquaporin family protein [uncultured Clostridium sp.]SCJ93127.1 Glyceroaquaporin [uncultured Clostridium sp.]